MFRDPPTSPRPPTPQTNPKTGRLTIMTGGGPEVVNKLKASMEAATESTWRRVPYVQRVMRTMFDSESVPLMLTALAWGLAAFALNIAHSAAEGECGGISLALMSYAIGRALVRGRNAMIERAS